MTPTILTDVAGHVLYEDGPRLVFVDRKTGWTFWARFVLGLVTVIVGLNGVAQLGMALTDNGGILIFGVIATGVAAVGLFALVTLHRWVKSRARQPISDFRPIVVLDRERNVLMGPEGQTIAALQDVYFAKAFQFTSSAPGLMCRWPGGRAIVSRGRAMGLGGVDDTVSALRQRGLTVRGREIAL